MITSSPDNAVRRHRVPGRKATSRDRLHNVDDRRSPIPRSGGAVKAMRRAVGLPGPTALRQCLAHGRSHDRRRLRLAPVQRSERHPVSRSVTGVPHRPHPSPSSGANSSVLPLASFRGAQAGALAGGDRPTAVANSSFPWRAVGKVLRRAGLPAGALVRLRGRGRAAQPSQAVTVATRWRWSSRRLWVAAISRHSDRQAARPRRWKRWIRSERIAWGRAVASGVAGRSSDRRRADRLTFCRPAGLTGGCCVARRRPRIPA